MPTMISDLSRILNIVLSSFLVVYALYMYAVSMEKNVMYISSAKFNSSLKDFIHIPGSFENCKNIYIMVKKSNTLVCKLPSENESYTFLNF